MAFIAEDVPWYMVDRTEVMPWRDEDVAMSAPERVGEFDTEDEARQALHELLLEISRYDFEIRGGESDKYTTAADAILFGADGIRLYGRYYRVREE